MVARFIQFLLIILFLNQSLLLRLPAAELVLCIGADGHLAIELAESKDYCHHDELIVAGAIKSVTVVNQTSHIHNCVDIPIEINHREEYRITNIGLSFNNWETGHLYLYTFSQKRSSVINNSYFNDESHQQLTSTRSTVLLI